jgi:hypothetical protein
MIRRGAAAINVFDCFYGSTSSHSKPNISCHNALPHNQHHNTRSPTLHYNKRQPPEFIDFQTATMRLFAFVLAALTLFAGVIAVDVQKSVIVTYPLETPDFVLDEAKKAIIESGGIITHEYSIIK